MSHLCRGVGNTPAGQSMLPALCLSKMKCCGLPTHVSYVLPLRRCHQLKIYVPSQVVHAAATDGAGPVPASRSRGCLKMHLQSAPCCM